MKAVPYILKRVGCITNLSAHDAEPFQHFLGRRQSLFLKILGNSCVIYLHGLLEPLHGNETVNFHNLAFLIWIQLAGIITYLQKSVVFPVFLHETAGNPQTAEIKLLIADSHH